VAAMAQHPRAAVIAKPAAVAAALAAALAMAAVAGRAADAADRPVGTVMRVAGDGESRQIDGSQTEDDGRGRERVDPDGAGHVAGTSEDGHQCRL